MWQNDIQHGKGIYRYANKDVYEGNYVQGERDGEGIFRYANGDVYTGISRQARRTGMALLSGVMATLIQGSGKPTNMMEKGL